MSRPHPTEIRFEIANEGTYGRLFKQHDGYREDMGLIHVYENGCGFEQCKNQILTIHDLAQVTKHMRQIELIRG